MLPNEQIDLFIGSHMDDKALEIAWSSTSRDARELAQGYVDGYNRFLSDQAGKLPKECNAQAWVKPMTLAEFRRLSELTATQAGVAALADAIVGAQPPAPTAAINSSVDLADAAQAMRDAGLLDSPLGSNAWAFGREVTANGSGTLLGNPHFPWDGVNRFWEMHLTIPGELDVMGVALGHNGVVQIGFNHDVAWSHTVSTGKRFTLHELTLAPGDTTSYMMDGKPVKMVAKNVSISVRTPDGSLQEKSRIVWSTQWGPIVVIPRAGLNWTTKTAYAVQDVNAGNTRYTDTWLGFGRAKSVGDMQKAMANLGLPWVNTIATDRNGNALYADASAVPDVDAAQLERCAPSKPAAGLRQAAGLIVLDGSRSDCGWYKDARSAVPGLTPIERMPSAVRTDWVQNSNDSFFYTNPNQKFGNISPLVGDARVERPRTRAGLTEIPEMLALGKVTPQTLQQQLFANRNFMGHLVVPELLAACLSTPPQDALAKEGCSALRGWDMNNELDSRGAHLFREFWGAARAIPGVHRESFDLARPVATPAGLKMSDPEIAAKVWTALSQAVGKVKAAGFALDAPLGTVQHPLITNEPIALHGGDEFEGVLNNLGNQFAPGITSAGLRIDYGTSYVQTVTFDDNGPVAQAILTYGQSTNPASVHATDQLKLYSAKQWPVLPFHEADVNRNRIGDVLTLTRP
jgi:acyl-homoserine-lactone acylase